MKRTAVVNQQCVESGADLGEQLTAAIFNSIRWRKHPGFPRGQRARGAAHLVVFEPGEALGGQHEPVLLGSSLHDADVVDSQPAFADDLEERRGRKVTSSKDVQSPRGDLATGAGRRCVMVHQSVGGRVGGGGVVISVVVVRRCALIPQAEACDSLLGGGSVKCIKRVVKAQTGVICVGCISAASLRGAPCRVIIRLDYCQSCTA